MRKHDRSWPGVCRAFQHHRSCLGTALKCPGMCATAEPARPAVEIPSLPAPAVASVAAWPWRGRRRRERSRNGAPGAAPNGSSSPPARRAGCCRCVSAASSTTSPTSANRKVARSVPEQPRAGPAAINIIVGVPARRRRTSPPPWRSSRRQAHNLNSTRAQSVVTGADVTAPGGSGVPTAVVAVGKISPVGS
jgi:hypothetical protein